MTQTELPPDRSVWILIIILGGGLALGLSSRGIVDIALSSFIIGAALNAFIMLEAAHYSEPRRYLSALYFAVPAGLFDAVKIAFIAIMVRFFARVFS